MQNTLINPIQIPDVKEKGWFSFSLTLIKQQKALPAEYLKKIQKGSEKAKRNENYYIQRYGSK